MHTVFRVDCGIWLVWMRLYHEKLVSRMLNHVDYLPDCPSVPACCLLLLLAQSHHRRSTVPRMFIITSYMHAMVGTALHRPLSIHHLKHAALMQHYQWKFTLLLHRLVRMDKHHSEVALTQLSLPPQIVCLQASGYTGSLIEKRQMFIPGCLDRT